MPPYSSHRLLIASITTKAVWKARRENTDYFAKLGGVTSGRMKGMGGESLSEIHGFERDEWISLDCCCFTRHRVWEGLAKILIQITEATGSEDEHPHLFRQWSRLHGPGGREEEGGITIKQSLYKLRWKPLCYILSGCCCQFIKSRSSQKTHRTHRTARKPQRAV